MSDTEDTEVIKTNSISSKKKYAKAEVFSQEEEITKLGTIEIISDLFINICEENKTKKKQKNLLLKSFTNKNIPSITIKDYLIRLSKYSKVNESTIILILIYIDRVCNMKHFFLTYFNIHKMILASFILAIKYNEESYYFMSYYSKLGGVSMSELENLESEFLELIEFNLFIEQKLYDKYYNDLMSLKNVDIDEEEEEENEDQEAEEDEKEEKGEKNEIKMENFHKIESNKEKRIMEDLYCSKSKMNIIDVSYKKEDIKF
jgi:hypothetical protein